MTRSTESTHRLLKAIVLTATLAATVAAGLWLISNQGRTSMVPEETLSQQRPDRPPIDLTAPAITETATFAMG